MAEKLGIQGSIPDFKLAPADYNPPELFGAMWKPEYLQELPSAPSASGVAPPPSTTNLEIANEDDPIGLEALLEDCLSDLVDVDGPVEEFIAASKSASHWTKLTNVETRAEKELFVSFVGMMTSSLTSTGIDYTTMQDMWAAKVNVEAVTDPDMQIRPKSAHILKLYGEAVMMERLFAHNMQAISPNKRAAAERSMRNMTAPQPFTRTQPAPSKMTRAPSISLAKPSKAPGMVMEPLQQQEGAGEDEDAVGSDSDKGLLQQEEDTMLNEGSQTPQGTGFQEQQRQLEQTLLSSARPASQDPLSAPRQSQELAPRQSQELVLPASPSQQKPTVQHPLAARRQSQQRFASTGPSQDEEPAAVPHSMAAPKRLQQLPSPVGPSQAGPSQPEPAVVHPPSATHAPPSQPSFQGMYPCPPLHAPPSAGPHWYPHHYSLMPPFHPGYPAIPMAHYPYPPQAHQHGIAFHHPQALSGAIPAANAGTTGALPSRNAPVARAIGRGGAGTPKTCQKCLEMDGKRILKKNHTCPHKKD